MALGSTQPLTEMSISWGKDGRFVRLTTYHHPAPFSWNLGTLTSWNPLGPSGPVTGLIYLYLLYTVCVENMSSFGISIYRGGIIESGTLIVIMAGEFVTERLSSVFTAAEIFWWLKI